MGFGAGFIRQKNRFMPKALPNVFKLQASKGSSSRCEARQVLPASRTSVEVVNTKRKLPASRVPCCTVPSKTFERPVHWSVKAFPFGPSFLLWLSQEDA